MPKQALTDAAVKRVKSPAKGQTDLFDKGYPGLALRVSYGGAKSFGYFYRHGGKFRRMTLGTYPAMTLAGAREAWRQARGVVQSGKDPVGAINRQRSFVAFSSVLEDWLARDQHKNRTEHEIRLKMAKDVLPVWSDRKITEIGKRDVLDVLDAVVDRGAPQTARKLHAYLHRLFKWCVGHGILEVNPVADLDMPAEASKRDRVLTDKELVVAYRRAGDLGFPFGPLVQLLILTGARRGEIGGLRWSEIDLGEGAIKLIGARTKNGEPHRIPLSAPALEVVNEIPRIVGSDFVFSTTNRSSVRGWSKTRKRLGDGDWTIHDIRRTVATGLQKQGVSLQVIEAVLNHVSGSRGGIVGVYQRHSFDEEKAAALEAWGAHVMALVHGSARGKVVAYRRKTLT